MQLLLLHPEVATRDCGHCQKFLYDEQTGEPVLNRLDEQRERDAECPPLCRTKKGCPKGTPENPNTLTPDNEAAYQHYRECRAVGEFPDDPVVRRNAELIRDVEDRVQQQREYLKQIDLKHFLLTASLLRAKT